ncbi:MAG: hypothetical protein K0R63_819 [Rickettsiales bacterium]|jgi:hypothetical protein|nr:hypothetical protein [Rickettsiales bacterium]
MKNALLIALIVALLPLTASANGFTEDCILHPNELESTFIITDPSIKDSIKEVSPVRHDRHTRHLSHTIEFPSGERVIYLVGGCMHYGFSYTFTRVPVVLKKDEVLFDIIRDEARLLPIGKGSERERLDKIIDTLEVASADKQNWITPKRLYADFGDANVSLELKPDGFAISYDFPL